MTVQAERVDPWLTRPGWGISVDLTPPEIVNERYVARLRRIMGSGLVLLLLLVVGAYVLSVRHHGSAQTALEDEQATTAQLQAQVNEFRDITAMQSTLSQLKTQLSTVMGSDVRFDEVVGQIKDGLPAQMRITNESVAINSAAAAAAATAATAAGTDGTDGTDATGDAAADGSATATTVPTTIGTISLTGESRSLDDVAAYVERLQAIPGVTDVVPTSNTAGEKGVDWTVTMNMDTDLLSHRFDATADTP